MTRDEVAGLLAQMEGETALLARLLYGTGMRLMEGVRLRVKDVDFDRLVIIVREAKGGKDRVVMLPRSLAAALRRQMLAARAVWESDRHAQQSGLKRHMHWRPNTPKSATRGAGSGCSRRPRCRLTQGAALNGGIICLRSACSGR